MSSLRVDGRLRVLRRLIGRLGKKGTHMEQQLDLYVQEDLEFTVEELTEGAALGCFACAGTASTASCPGSSAATASTASTIG